MATETQTTSTTSGITSELVLAGAVGGLIGGVLFGLMMQFVMPKPLLEMAIPAMYGIRGPVLGTGWAIHLFHGAVLGVVYVVLVGTVVGSAARSMAGALGLAVGYGILLAAVLAVLVMPVWLSMVGFPGAPPFPNIAMPGTVMTTIGHIVYAIPVTLSYALVSHE